MSSQPSWSAPTSTAEAHGRASGRRKYNALRQFNADLRRIEVGKLLTEYGFIRGTNARIAKDLGVHASTVTRDLRRILNPDDGRACPVCERWMSHKHWDRLQEDEAAIRRAVLSWRSDRPGA